jgi:hypothetical protein
MLLTLIGALSIGVVVGAAVDELLRVGDTRSRRVIGASLVGAVAGLVVVRRAIGGDDALVGALAAVLGAALLAFALRVRISAAIARMAPIAPISRDRVPRV